MRSMLYTLIWAISVDITTGGNIRLGFLGNNGSWGPPFFFRNLGSAISVASDFVNTNTSILPNHTIEILSRDTRCNQKLVLERLIELHLDQNVTGIIGAVCSDECMSLGLLASQWNIPVISYTCAADALSDKRTYDTFLRTAMPLARVGVIAAETAYQIGWSRIGVFFNREVSTYDPLFYIYSGFKEAASPRNITVVGPEAVARDSPRPEVRAALARMTKQSRIILLVAYITEPQANRSSGICVILEEAYDMGLFQNNDYVFIIPATEPDEDHTSISWALEWTQYPEKMRVAVEHCLFITQTPYFLSEAYSQFMTDVFDRLADPPWYSHLESVEDVSYRAGNIYDALVLYALTADRMIRAGLDHNDGREFLLQAQEILFTGMTGQVSVDEEGNRNLDYIVSEFEDGVVRKVADYRSFTGEYVEIVPVIWADGTTIPPLDTPPCGFDGEFCIPDEVDPIIILAASAGCLIFGLIMILVVMSYLKKRAFEKDLMEANWRLDYSQIQFSKQGRFSMVSMMSETLSQQLETGLLDSNAAVYNGERVYVKKLNLTSVDWKKRAVLLELVRLRDMQHDNIIAFVGACVEAPNICVVTSYCQKGCLGDILENGDFTLDLTFKISIALDIIAGLKFIHKSDIHYHGKLRSSSCLVDSRWNIKLTNFGLREFMATDTERPVKSDEDLVDYRKLQWVAPEHVRAMGEDPSQFEGSQKGDIYSFAIILYEVCERAGPYGNTDKAPMEIVEKVRESTEVNPYRPDTSTGVSPRTMVPVLENCWAENPDERWDLPRITKELIAINGGKKVDIMDNMVSMLEKYASNLEEIVADRTTQLIEEKKKTEQLLYQMLPRSVADQLKNGKSVAAESFDQVTIFFSDIVGFTSLSAMSTPFQVVTLLNDLYTEFDSIIEKFDVYKVETIGDAYMVVSGLPTRNGNQHAGQIATMSLELLSSTLDFKVRHMPDKKLLLRIGMHSGACVSGVVGLKMPRYCLFGDTVNTASRMESNGLALHIHVSIDAHAILEELGGYHLAERGLVEMKGKGLQKTYWLKGKDGFDKKLPPIESELKE